MSGNRFEGAKVLWKDELINSKGKTTYFEAIVQTRDGKHYAVGVDIYDGHPDPVVRDIESINHQVRVYKKGKHVDINEEEEKTLVKLIIGEG